MRKQQRFMKRHRLVLIGILILIIFLAYFLFRSLNPLPTVTILSAPQSVQAGQEFNITWRIDYPHNTTTPHTAVHFNVVHITPTSSFEGQYLWSTQFFQGKIPATFSDVVNITKPGIYYFRAHLELNDNGYWSDEGTLVVK